ncbi:pyridoxal phosphate-dependent aminotransferase family protein [Aggregatimonas sangjinii]|uniref:Pyridoxal phosphate-dependent aminotransferase family protein n=1 Tax=Aggregatimonas sangjinii TaxID=2583587 RepID=A0A5B7SZD3_9FLAO|nr:pyridoxal phosphate-dependent aminotransferase family protein [Aggregatimonas sangjinii]QCX02164.1 pyridoxal phosphate-dependent aminotransferase family protein [Aggregatimonas sangjinii]
MAEFPKKLQRKLEERTENNTLRFLVSPEKGIDFSSNDYLGFSKNKSLSKRTTALLSERGITQNGATGSRLLSGNHELYSELEARIAETHKAESALIFNSGYDANLGFFGSVPRRGDVIFYDELAHASIRDGIRLSHAKSYKFKHNNLEDLKQGIERSRNELQRQENVEIYIVIESVYSMDGDSPDLEAFASFSIANHCYLVVDEAHAAGIFGSEGGGLVQQLDLEQKVFARIITYGKAFGSHGAAIVGSADLKTYLVNFARSFIYSTGLSPHSVATLVVAYKLMTGVEGKQQRKRLQENIRYFNLQLSELKLGSYFIPSQSAIHSCVVPGNDWVKSIADQLQNSGFAVRAILSPTVPTGQERLRFCLHSYDSKEDMTRVLSCLSKIIHEA